MVIAGGNAQSSACAGDTLFAAVGDVHGEMHAMVSLAESWEAQSGLRISFVLQTGDFEPHRHETDLQTMAAPSKHKRVGDFPDFAAGSSSFPWPVYFIGGNHDPYGFLDQHPQGAQIAHNCHYLGRVALTVLSGLRVVSLTGIYREKDYSGKRPPVDSLGTISNKVFASFNETDIDAALSYDHADVLVMHDWPADIVHPEDLSKVQAQCRRLRFAHLGNQYSRLLVGLLNPQLVLCGHMHIPYEAQIRNSADATSKVHCLGRASQGSDGLEVFRIDKDGEVHVVA